MYNPKNKETLSLAKGGKLYETYWHYDEANDIGEYRVREVTDQAISRLFDLVELDEDVTLKDIFLLLNTQLNIFDTILGNWCKEVVTEGLNEPEKPYDLSVYDPEQIEYLELKYTPEYDEYDNKDHLYGITKLDFGGVGVVLQSEYNNHKKGERIPWAISFTPSNELINIPIKVNNKLEIYEGIMKTERLKPCKKLIELNNPEYTLGQVLHSIIWELSFHGDPSDRNKLSKKLKKIVEDIKLEE